MRSRAWAGGSLCPRIQQAGEGTSNQTSGGVSEWPSLGWCNDATTQEAAEAIPFHGAGLAGLAGFGWLAHPPTSGCCPSRRQGWGTRPQPKPSKYSSVRVGKLCRCKPRQAPGGWSSAAPRPGPRRSLASRLHKCPDDRRRTTTKTTQAPGNSHHTTDRHREHPPARA
jgi:hypothetical protein